MIQGGDISYRDGTVGESIFGLKFKDENFELKHERKGMLAMANSGPNTNRSQFFITCTLAPHLNGKHVIFGKVVKGFGVVRSIDHVNVANGNLPVLDVIIMGCGEIPEGADDGAINFFKDGDTYPDWSANLDKSPEELLWWMTAKSFGNGYFKMQDYNMALNKYCKGLHYLDGCWDKEGVDLEKILCLRKTKSQIYNNCSACKFKLRDFNGALLDADFAIREEVNNAKALFHQRQAYMALNDIGYAVESFKKALEFEPNDGGIKKELTTALKKISDKHTKEKKSYSKMFL